jgi:hypothetical protein
MLVCAGLVLVGGIVSVNLWRELRAERELNTGLQAQVSQLQAQVDELQAASPALPRFASQPADATLMPALPRPAPQAAVTTEGERPIQASLDVPRFVLDRQEMMKDPEYRKARLAQTRMSLPQNFPGLIEELGLGPEDADRLFDLLAESQLEMSDVSMLAATINGVPPDPVVMEDANRRRQEMQRKQEESLMAMLGANRYSQWQDYQQTRGPRQQVVQLGRTLEGVGVPLTAEQSRSLTAAYIAEQKRQRDDTQRMFNSARQSGPVDQERMMEERFKVQAESNRRIVDAAKPHLNAQQLDALQASLDQQLVMSRSSSRLMRQQMERQGQSPVQSISIVTAPPPPPIP